MKSTEPPDFNIKSPDLDNMKKIEKINTKRRKTESRKEGHSLTSSYIIKKMTDCKFINKNSLEKWQLIPIGSYDSFDLIIKIFEIYNIKVDTSATYNFLNRLSRDIGVTSHDYIYSSIYLERYLYNMKKNNKTVTEEPGAIIIYAIYCSQSVQWDEPLAKKVWLKWTSNLKCQNCKNGTCGNVKNCKRCTRFKKCHEHRICTPYNVFIKRMLDFISTFDYKLSVTDQQWNATIQWIEDKNNDSGSDTD